MEKFKIKTKLNIGLYVFFCFFILFFGQYSVYAEEVNPSIIMLTASNVALKQLNSGEYFASENVTVDFNSVNNVEYKITQNGNEACWTNFNEAFILPADYGMINYYIVTYTEVIEGIVGEENYVEVIIDQEKPMLLIISAPPKNIDDVYTGQFLDFIVRQTDSGVGFETDEIRLPVLWRTFDNMGMVIDDWTPTIQHGNDYKVTFDNPEITRVEFSSIDICGNSTKIMVAVSIPKGKPVIESVRVEPATWVNGLIQDTKNVIFTVGMSEVAVNDFLIVDKNYLVIRDWAEVLNFAGGEYFYSLPEGEYTVWLRNADGLISDGVDFKVEHFDYTMPEMDVIKVEYNRNNIVQAGRLYFELNLIKGEDGAPLKKVVYKKVDCEDKHEILLAPINLADGGTLYLYNNIDSGVWVIELYAESGLVSNRVIREMKDFNEIENKWKDLINNINFFNITFNSVDAIIMAEEFVDDWVNFAGNASAINNIELDNYGAGGNQLLNCAREIYKKKVEFLQDIEQEINEIKKQPLTTSSLQKLTTTLNNAYTLLNCEQILSEKNELVDNLQQVKDALFIKLNNIKIDIISEVNGVPLGVDVLFNTDGAIGIPASIVFDEGEEVNLINYIPFKLQKIFLYWIDDSGERPEGDSVILEVGEGPRTMRFVAVWQDINIVARERVGQTLENLQEQLPNGISWVDKTIIVEKAGVYEVDVSFTVNNQMLIRKVAFMVIPKIEEEFLTTQRLKTIELPTGWEWENETMFLNEGKNEYTVVYTINKTLPDGQVQSLAIKYVLEIEGEKPKQENESKFIFIIISALVITVACGVALFIIKKKRHQKKSS